MSVFVIVSALYAADAEPFAAVCAFVRVSVKLVVAIRRAENALDGAYLLLLLLPFISSNCPP